MSFDDPHDDDDADWLEDFERLLRTVIPAVRLVLCNEALERGFIDRRTWKRLVDEGWK